MKKLILAAFGALALSTATHAADVYDGSYKDPTAAAPYSAPVRSWSGLWIGALGGYQFSNSEVSDVETRFGDDLVVLHNHGETVDGLGQDGFFGEVQIGYDQQISQRLVVGVFGGLNLNTAEHSAKFSRNDIETPEDSFTNTALEFEQEWGGVLGARVGVLKSPDTMFYLAGGWAFGELSKLRGASNPESSDSAVADLFEDQETDLSGWFGEVGMETRVSGNIYLTVAGRYTDYSAITVLSEVPEAGFHAEKITLDKDDLSAMVGLKIKLNEGRLY